MGGDSSPGNLKAIRLSEFVWRRGVSVFFFFDDLCFHGCRIPGVCGSLLLGGAFFVEGISVYFFFFF